MRRMLDVDLPGKRVRPNLGWKDACKRYKIMTEAGLKDDIATNRAESEWRKKLISYIPDCSGV